MTLHTLRIFLETKCESCGGTKRKNMAFCSVCYFKLSPPLRNLLWKRFGEGFEEAYVAALEQLKGGYHAEERA